MKTKILCLAFLFVQLFQTGCTEPFEIETIDYESVLVVESTITNELKNQVVKLSRTSTLENSNILYEKNASVTVSNGNGIDYNFSLDEKTGFYVSDQEFSAQPGEAYTLKVIAQDGRQYTSTAVTLPQTVEMDAVYAERISEPIENKDGVQVLVNTEDETGNAKYFRYEYEETYEVVAPYPSPYLAEIVNYNGTNGTFNINLTPRQPERVCYSTEISTGINQTATTEFNENKVFRFPVKYLSKTDARMQSRYSILVKQYVQSIEAYTFYKIINELGSVESLLSQGQPGYVTGNMISNADPDEKVLGFFEISSMTSKRIYFNYEDFGVEKPPYFVDCDLLLLDYNDATTLDNDLNERAALYAQITYQNYQVVDISQSSIYRIVQEECSVCTSISSNVKPDFWED